MGMIKCMEMVVQRPITTPTGPVDRGTPDYNDESAVLHSYGLDAHCRSVTIQ